jgi:DNA-binding Xre family transcriptional regulator
MSRKQDPAQMAADVIFKFGNQKAAAKACGLSQASLSLIVNKKMTDIRLSTIEALERGLKAKV